MSSVLVFDDDEGRGAQWRDDIAMAAGGGYEVSTLGRADFEEVIEELESRRRAARKAPESQHRDTPFDSADVLVLDYDLFEVAGSNLTGEEVAYLARCYSSCGLIVGVNQLTGDFDLTLRGQLTSFADVNLRDHHLRNPGLWTRGEWQDFRPWYWPCLDWELSLSGLRTEFVGRHLDRKIGDTPGFEGLFTTLPRAIIEPVAGNQEEPGEATLRGIALSPYLGLRDKDKPLSEDAVIRIGAWRLAKWLDACVRPNQDSLIDAPYAVARYPSLLAGDAEDLETWNRTAAFRPADELGIRSDLIRSAEVLSPLLRRPLWRVPDLLENQDIVEIKEPWSRTDPGFVFLEDISAFAPLGEAREFVADLPSPHVRRYVTALGTNRHPGESVRYEPPLRFSM